MKCGGVVFTFFDVAGAEGKVRVVFLHDQQTGKPTLVRVQAGDSIFPVENSAGRYKPCVTHCKDLIRQALGKPPADNFAARRVEEQRRQKPALKVHKWGHGN